MYVFITVNRKINNTNSKLKYISVITSWTPIFVKQFGEHKQHTVSCKHVGVGQKRDYGMTGIMNHLLRG